MPARGSDLDEISSETEGESEDESDQHDEAQSSQAQAVAQDLWSLPGRIRWGLSKE